jgi:alkanesulfonate monooxygenase SsuD/methylene tetrahydromethanopterin reductase-like flavin-dependent oxidoreductase (luciferase family)
VQVGHAQRLLDRWVDDGDIASLPTAMAPLRGQRTPVLQRRAGDRFHFYIANSREQGIREAGKYYEENLKMFGPLRLVRALTDEQIAATADPTRAPHAGLPRIADAIQAGGVLCGSPDEIIEHLKKLKERYPGLERVMVSLSVGVPQAVVVEQLERFAADVMPAFQGVPEAALPD